MVIQIPTPAPDGLFLIRTSSEKRAPNADTALMRAKFLAIVQRTSSAGEMDLAQLVASAKEKLTTTPEIDATKVHTEIICMAEPIFSWA